MLGMPEVIKNVGFRSACIDISIMRNSKRLIATGTVLEISALPNLQKLAKAWGSHIASVVKHPIPIRRAACNVDIRWLPCFGGR